MKLFFVLLLEWIKAPYSLCRVTITELHNALKSWRSMIDLFISIGILAVIMLFFLSDAYFVVSVLTLSWENAAGALAVRVILSAISLLAIAVATAMTSPEYDEYW